MSYCRIGENSDVYAFSDGTSFVVQVARNRSDALDEDAADAMPASDLWQWLQEHSHPIGGRCDGEEFVLNTPAELVEKLRDLLALGYRVEPSTWATIESAHPGTVPGFALAARRAMQPN